MRETACQGSNICRHVLYSQTLQVTGGETLVKKTARKMARDSNDSAVSSVLRAIQTSCKCNKDLHLKTQIKNIYQVFVSHVWGV